MILEETVNKLIRDIIGLLLESPGYAIKAKQKDAPRPTGEYAEVDTVSNSRLGWEQREYEDNQNDLDITENISGLRSIMMSISFFRGEAVDNANKVRIGVIRESIQTLFRAANLGFTSCSEVREISEPLEDGWEKRAQFDIVLNAVGTDSDIIRSIQSVDISGEYEIRGLTYNFEIQVQ
jgi:hypothetical protein